MWLLDMFSVRRRTAAFEIGINPPAAASRRLPVIKADACTGCGQCLEACHASCLELVWGFSTLTRAENCTGEGRCAEVCPEKIIRMASSPVEPLTARKAGHHRTQN